MATTQEFEETMKRIADGVQSHLESYMYFMEVLNNAELTPEEKATAIRAAQLAASGGTFLGVLAIHNDLSLLIDMFYNYINKPYNSESEEIASGEDLGL